MKVVYADSTCLRRNDPYFSEKKFWMKKARRSIAQAWPDVDPESYRQPVAMLCTVDEDGCGFGELWASWDLKAVSNPDATFVKVNLDRYRAKRAMQASRGELIAIHVVPQWIEDTVFENEGRAESFDLRLLPLELWFVIFSALAVIIVIVAIFVLWR